MPSLSDIPGKDLAAGTGRRAGKVAAGAGMAVIAIGGYVVRRLLRRGGSDEGAANADAISEPPTPQAVAAANGEPAPIEPADAPDAPAPTREEPPAPEKPPTPEEPPAPEESPATDQPPAPDEAPAPEESPATSDEPPLTTGTDAPPKPEVEPGDISKDKSPHHALNNPVGDPDPTEWPDPYEKREDPRDPADPDGAPFGEEPHAPTNAESTSEPHPSEDLEAGERAEPPKRDKLDD